MASIIDANRQQANAFREASNLTTAEYLKRGLDNAYLGNGNAVFNHRGKWKGFTPNGKGLAEVYGEVIEVDTVNGSRGIPYNTPVVIRVAKGYKSIDFV